MKKITVLMLSVVLCLCAVSCGSDDSYEKYGTLIEYLEKGDFDMAKSYIDELEEDYTAESGTTEAVSVEITADNWQDYFEIVQEKHTNTNDFGETTDVYYTPYLVLKEGYKTFEEGETRTKIAVEFNCVAEWRYVEIDLAAAEITVGELVPDRSPEEINGETLTVTSDKTSLSNGRTWSEGMQQIKTDFEIVRMQGTLWLEK